jgi:hypothetical protein
MNTGSRIPWRLRPRLWLLACLALGVTTSESAWAHHGSSTTRVGSVSAFRATGSAQTSDELPQVAMNAGLRTTFFGRALEGTLPYEKAELGSVFVNALDWTALLELKSRTQFALRAPVGAVIVDSAQSGRHVSSGLGDLELSVGQELLSWFGLRAPSFTTTLRAGVLMPTGHYEPTTGLRWTDVQGTSDGTIRIVTHDTRASLGADSWAPLGALENRWQVARRVALLLDSNLFFPASSTRDGIRWGADVTTLVGTNTELIANRLHALGAFDYRHHFADQVPHVDEVSGASSLGRTGRRDELAAQLGFGIAISRTSECLVRARVPVWQQVAGIQLAQTFSAQASYAIAWSL